jgi:hypothetical protein
MLLPQLPQNSRAAAIGLQNANCAFFVSLISNTATPQ